VFWVWFVFGKVYILVLFFVYLVCGMSGGSEWRYGYALNVLAGIGKFVAGYYSSVLSGNNEIFIPRPYREVEMRYIVNVIEALKGWSDADIKSFSGLLSEYSSVLKEKGIDVDFLLSLRDKSIEEVSKLSGETEDFDKRFQFISNVSEVVRSISRPTIIVIDDYDAKILDYINSKGAISPIFWNDNVVAVFWLPKELTVRFARFILISTCSMNVILKRELVNQLPEMYRKLGSEVDEEIKRIIEALSNTVLSGLVQKLIDEGVELNLLIESLNRIIAKIYAMGKIDEDLATFTSRILYDEILPEISRFYELIPLDKIIMATRDMYDAYYTLTSKHDENYALSLALTALARFGLLVADDRGNLYLKVVDVPDLT